MGALTALLPVDVTARTENLGRLEDALADLVGSGQAAWPGVFVSPADFIRHAIARLSTSDDLIAAVERVQAADLYLACGCTLGDPAAYTAFERRFMPEVATYVAKINPSPEFADEVRQVLRAKLFVPAGADGPKIAQYSGRGALAGWLRVVSIRAAQNLVRYAKPHGPLDEAAFALQADGLDPELDYLKTRYAADLAVAFRAALSGLSARERILLELHFKDGLSAGAIASLQGVHEATIRRWLDKARCAVLEQTRAALRRRLGASSTEIDSLVDLVQSRLDGTLRGWLHGEAGTCH